MEAIDQPITPLSAKPICVGLTCWRWESNRTQTIVRLAQSVGVTVKLTEQIHGLRRDIQDYLERSPQRGTRTVDQLAGDFARAYAARENGDRDRDYTRAVLEPGFEWRAGIVPMMGLVALAAGVFLLLVRVQPDDYTAALRDALEAFWKKYQAALAIVKGR